jgi:plastocyanin
VLATLLLTLAACSPPGSAAAPGSVTIHLSEYKLDPTALTLAAGTYDITAVNSGTIGHALELRGNGIDVHTKDFAYPPGHAEGFQVTLTPGTYQFFCPIDGHRGLGMRASLVVH